MLYAIKFVASDSTHISRRYATKNCHFIYKKINKTVKEHCTFIGDIAQLNYSDNKNGINTQKRKIIFSIKQSKEK